jgi:hypothetical protein
VPQAGTTNGKAIASMVLGILSFVTGFEIGPFAVIFTILALVFGYQAKREIRLSGGLQGGEGMAIAGIVMGWIGVGLLLLIIFLVVVLGLAIIGFSAR